jgi:hypothetical protein
MLLTASTQSISALTPTRLRLGGFFYKEKGDLSGTTKEKRPLKTTQASSLPSWICFTPRNVSNLEDESH